MAAVNPARDDGWSVTDAVLQALQLEKQSAATSVSAHITRAYGAAGGGPFDVSFTGVKRDRDPQAGVFMRRSRAFVVSREFPPAQTRYV